MPLRYVDRTDAGRALARALQTYAHCSDVIVLGLPRGGVPVAAARPGAVQAIVSRGGRPDLAGNALRVVVAPTLLLVGGLDDVVLGLNRQAKSQMSQAETALEIVPDAGHLFEEPGALAIVAERAGAWFGRFLPTRRVSDPAYT